MVIKLDDTTHSRLRDVYILEVAPGKSVQIVNWNQIKKDYGDDKKYSNISIRHLDYERKEETMEIIKLFY